MRHLSVFCLLLILIPSLCLASQDNETCDVLLFDRDERDLFIRLYKQNSFYATINNITLPRNGTKNLFLINNVDDDSVLKTRWSNTASSSWNLSCNGKKRVFVEIDGYAEFKTLTKKTAIEKLYKYKMLKKLSLKDKKYVVTNEAMLDSKISLNEVFGDSKELKLRESQQIASSRQEVSTNQQGYSWGKTPQANRHAVAVIVGSKNYTRSNKGVPDVEFAHNDADAIFQYVTKVLGYREGNVILLKDATQADLVSTFGVAGQPKGKLYDWLRPGKSDVFIYYSGHGAPSLSNGQGYFLPVDADPQRVELNGYPLETFYENLAQLPARSVTVVLDACFSGSSQSGTVVKNASSISLRLVEAKNVLHSATVLTAADVTEVASWDTSAKHGLFTRYFLEGVSGKADGRGFGNSDGNVTLGELKIYLEDNVTYFARRNFSREQHPQISGNSAVVMSSNGQ